MSKQLFADKFGEQYDIFNEAVPWHHEFQLSVANELKKNFGNQPDIVLLEAGFGTGITTDLVLKALPSAKIIGIDNVANMVNKTLEYISKEDVDRVELRIGDLYEELKKIPDSSIDGFFSGYVLHNFEKELRKKVIAEIYRVLKPGAIYVNGDRIAWSDKEKQKLALSQAITNCRIFLEKHNDPDFYLDWVRHYLRDEEQDLIFTEDDQVETLETTGFKNPHYVFKHDLEKTCVALK